MVADFLTGQIITLTSQRAGSTQLSSHRSAWRLAAAKCSHQVFVVEKNKRVNPKAVVECETCADYEKIHAAAATCPTKAIKIFDRYTSEQLYP